MKEVVRMEKNRGEPKKKISTKRICKTTPKKELYIDYKGEFPLYNRYTLFFITAQPYDS